MTHNEVRNRLRPVARVAGVTHGVHILRHTFCSHLAMKGATSKQIQALAGHESLSTTEGYMHLAPGQAELAIALLNPRRRGRRREQRASNSLSLDSVSCCSRMGLGGAGYGNRTRLTGLGSQDITTMLSPLAACDYRRPAPFKSTSDAHPPRDSVPASCAACGMRG